MADLSFDDLRSAAYTLVSHGRRDHAVRLVNDGMGSLEDDRGYLLLAELHLDAGTREGAEEALTLLKFRRACRPGDVQILILLRRALRELGKHGMVFMLDRAVRWMSPSYLPQRPACGQD
jgi:hypothetical protein